jgi:hypothetical protein
LLESPLAGTSGGMPIFTFDGPKIRDRWVLGDLYSLARMLRCEN